ncbi:MULTISPECIES: hypothetical protein [unclassified Streptococcus]|uniref:hypothetical protein n=1 Tax=unclassified Streptococcus TaxID=2608887 RepID=UPI001071F473|nr:MULTISPECIES: hypothetical protein [unclassified Streptococcus]MBF0787538.1 hypothetical protein [Streptococcus sp. 19428wC2_LYSM12]MCQ9211437.1 hypothetical protein [Streptococcus sp. B01]MCQ9214752.1 hypothetical protein [Streptococcus sp. O1]TFV05489.1 hypothetical protein E4T79_06470 [Streptococcus sp. LYSM12]
MKKPIHLYILVVLSVISTLVKVWMTFILKFNEESMSAAFDAETVNSLRTAFAFETNLANKVLVIILFALLVLTIVFLFQKKNQYASYSYIAYLFGTLLRSTYFYIGEHILMNYIIGIVFFAIFLGVTVFFLLHKPKEKPSVAQTATDI